jgi:HK97 family phage major capsid protein
MADINRTSGNIVLPAAVSNEILSSAQELSVIQRAARQITLPGSGVAVNVVTSDPTPAWVGETAAKPVSNGSAATKVLRPYKVAVIETFSNEFRRDLPALYEALASRLPGVLAAKFDSTVLNGTAPGSDFDTLAAVTEAEVADYASLLAAFKEVTSNGGDVNGLIVSPEGEFDVLGITDGYGRPLFVSDLSANGTIGSVLGRPVFKSKAASNGDTIAVAGDWSKAVWGQVGEVSISISDQATLVVDENTTINLFQDNMFAVRVEAEYGFRVADTADFVRLVKPAA